MHKHAFFIGRFEPVHLAHLTSFKIGLEKADHLIIFVGSAKRPPDIRNPWSFNERVEILTQAIREFFGEDLSPSWSDYPFESIMSRITILPLRDYLYNDDKWVSEVYAKATSEGAQRGIRESILLGGYKDDSSYYLNSFPYWDFEAISMMYNRLSSIDIRYDLFKHSSVSHKFEEYLMPSTIKYLENWINTDAGAYIQDSYDFHVKLWKDYAQLEYPPIFVTADSLMIKSGCVLLIKRAKHPGKGLWALPGGYVKAMHTIKRTALKELREETKIMLPDAVLKSALYKDDARVFDHPQRSLRGRIITHVYRGNLGGSGELPSIDPKGGDDANEAHWIPIYDALQLEEFFFEDHYDILFSLISDY